MKNEYNRSEFSDQKVYRFSRQARLKLAFKINYTKADFLWNGPNNYSAVCCPNIYTVPEGSKWVTTPWGNMLFISSGVVLVSTIAGFLKQIFLQKAIFLTYLLHYTFCIKVHIFWEGHKYFKKSPILNLTDYLLQLKFEQVSMFAPTNSDHFQLE